MIKRLLVAALVYGSSLFPAPQLSAQPMVCYNGIVVRTTEGWPFCLIDDCPGGCEYCEVTPTCP
jgi:hypothetical protein